MPKENRAAVDIRPGTPIETSGVLVDSSSVSAELTDNSLAELYKGNTVSGFLTVDLVVLDPRTATPITLRGVRVEYPTAGIGGGIRKGQRFTVRAASYEDLLNRNVGAITAVLAPEPPPIQNKSIPTPVKIPDPMGSFGGKASARCEPFNKAEQEVKSYMGFTGDRGDLTIVQGKESGRSPGLLIQQDDGQLYLFDGTGQQYMAMDNHAVKIQSKLVTFGNADIGHTTFMLPFPMVENKVLDVVPNGTLLTPQPRLLINVLEAVNLATSVLDLIKLAKLCKQAAEIIIGVREGDLQEKVQQASISATESIYYGDRVDEVFIPEGQEYVMEEIEDVPETIVDAEDDEEEEERKKEEEKQRALIEKLKTALSKLKPRSSTKSILRKVRKKLKF